MSQTTIVDMEQLLEGSPEFVLPIPGEILTGKVVSMNKSSIIVDLNGTHTGLIAGREMRDSTDSASELKVGDDVTACVLEDENEEGLVILSLRRASTEKTWRMFLDAYENDTVIAVKPKEANKGGLLINMDGIKGFIPVSQLAPGNYPRVNGADSAQILARLQKLVGQEFKVKILNLDKETGKLILSERAAYAEQRNEALSRLREGDVIDGVISGIVKFGIFVAVDGLEGLVHISEIAWGHVSNANDYGKLGDKVKVKVIKIDGDKISFSIKQLTKDPWEDIEKNYPIGKKLKTKITRLAQFGAFVKLTDEVNGLIHTSEIPGNPKDPGEVLKIGETVEARVIEVNPNEKRVGLSLLPEGAAEAAPEVTEEKEEAAEETSGEVAEEKAE